MKRIFIYLCNAQQQNDENNNVTQQIKTKQEPNEAKRLLATDEIFIISSHSQMLSIGSFAVPILRRDKKFK